MNFKWNCRFEVGNIIYKVTWQLTINNLSFSLLWNVHYQTAAARQKLGPLNYYKVKTVFGHENNCYEEGRINVIGIIQDFFLYQFWFLRGSLLPRTFRESK